jgi:hypothetical protein
MRGRGAAVAPTCPQFGQVIRVSIGARCYRHGGGCKGLKSAQQLRRLAMLATMRRASSRVI